MRSSTISAGTKLCAVIGDPIEHTISPAMHNAAFEKLELDYTYLAFRVKSDELNKAIEGVRSLGIRGLSVTIPHKVAVMPMLDKLDPMADRIGAVNTVVNDDGILSGYNTDASGFLQVLLDKGIEPKGKNIAVLGAGGAARALCFILADRGANLVILNRLSGLEPAQRLAERVSRFSRKPVNALAISEENLKVIVDNSDILVNATSVGMSPDTEQTLVPAEFLRSGLVVFDIIYNPPRTRLLHEAEEKGAQIINGLEMLVWQGVSAFKLWTGVKPPVAVMREAAIKALNLNEK